MQLVGNLRLPTSSEMRRRRVEVLGQVRRSNSFTALCNDRTLPLWRTVNVAESFLHGSDPQLLSGSRYPRTSACAAIVLGSNQPAHKYHGAHLLTTHQKCPSLSFLHFSSLRNKEVRAVSSMHELGEDRPILRTETLNLATSTSLPAIKHSMSWDYENHTELKPPDADWFGPWPNVSPAEGASEESFETPNLPNKIEPSESFARRMDDWSAEKSPSPLEKLSKSLIFPSHSTPANGCASEECRDEANSRRQPNRSCKVGIDYTEPSSEED